jgi:hypothetical protein
MARVIFECDGCKKQEEGYFVDSRAIKPDKWYSRSDKEGTQIACSRECIDKIAKETNKTRVIMPF